MVLPFQTDKNSNFVSKCEVHRRHVKLALLFCRHCSLPKDLTQNTWRSESMWSHDKLVCRRREGGDERNNTLGNSKWRLVVTFWGSPLNGNFWDYNGNVYRWYCHECFFLCRQCKRCRMEQGQAVFLSWFCFAGINPTGKKETMEFMESEYGSVVFFSHWDSKGAIYGEKDQL